MTQRWITHKQDGPLVIEAKHGSPTFWLRCDECRTVSGYRLLSDARDAFEAHDHEAAS